VVDAGRAAGVCAVSGGNRQRVRATPDITAAHLRVVSFMLLSGFIDKLL